MQASEPLSSILNNAGSQAEATGPQDLILIVFIHGFKGTDSTFGEFPQRLQHIVSESIGNVTVESIVLPAYETKGDLVSRMVSLCSIRFNLAFKKAAVIRFADWLTDLTVRREVANGLGGGAGKANIVLCGHSMGGLLAADALIEFVNTRPDKLAPLWPNIVACIAFDTPASPLIAFVRNSATQAAGYVRTATNVLSSFKGWGSKSTTTATFSTNAPIAPGAASAAQTTTTSTTSVWQKWAPAAYAVGGALLAGAAAGTAYYKRDDIGVGYTWVSDHLKYVGSLWSQEELEARLNKLLEIESQMGVLFHTYDTPLGKHFVANRNTLASDEIQAHTGMFDSKTNDGYYELGLSTAQLVRVAVQRHRAASIPPQPPPKASPVHDFEKRAEATVEVEGSHRSPETGTDGTHSKVEASPRETVPAHPAEDAILPSPPIEQPAMEAEAP
ncbi:hypothetical protein BN946_scf184908.g128 [Trametes cinnabarina]|uniref:AB hydrolase-1 domain-containing protein n=1 Tax=Pycnoporus cinnabarinus TaxID=5643 RepID=A0A060SAK5_PYCCI|nr:hypothetical protein BN946_scf184908.g128 [Trametes cinnabarina]